MKSFVVFLFGIGIIVIGIINGFLYTGYGYPENMVFLGANSVLFIPILWWHRKVSKNWKLPEPESDIWTKDRIVPVFRIVFGIALYYLFIYLVVSWAFLDISPKEHGTEILSCVSISIASFIGYLKEKDYTERWFG